MTQASNTVLRRPTSPKAHPSTVKPGELEADYIIPSVFNRQVTPTAVEKHGDRIDLVKVDVEENQELASRFGVQGIPGVKAFKKGSVVNEFVGAQPPAAVDAFLDSLLQPSAFEGLLAELRESGEDEELLASLEREDYEGALDLLLGRLADADRKERDRILRADGRRLRGDRRAYGPGRVLPAAARERALLTRPTSPRRRFARAGARWRPRAADRRRTSA